MRPEDFDYRLRQKLDEINPTFNEQDWIRLSNKMKSRKPAAVPFFYNRLLPGLLFLILASGLMVWRWNVNKLENKQSTTIQKTTIFAETQQPVNNADHNSKINESSNTSESTVNSSVNSSLDATTNASEQLNEKELKFNNLNKTNSSSDKTASTSGGANDHNTIQTKQHSSNSTHDNSKSNTNFNSQRNLNDLVADEKISEHKIISAQSINSSNSIAEPKETNNQISKATEVNETADLLPTIANTNSELNAFEMLPVDISYLPMDEINIRNKMKYQRSPKIQKWMAGTVLLGTVTHINAGVAFEVKTKNSISFGTGLVLQKYFKQDYIDQNAFVSNTETQFSDLIKPRSNEEINYSNIKISSFDVLLPLNLKYYIPLSGRYSLFANAGVQLTLYSKTNLDFEYMNYNDPIIFNESDYSQPANEATLINHFTLGAGIQREFRNFVIQTSILLQKSNSHQAQVVENEAAAQLSLMYKF